MPEEQKQCTKCGEWKALDAFCKHKDRKGGLRYQCKDCDREYRQANKEKIAVYKREHRLANKESLAAYKHEWRQTNKEALAVRRRKYYQDNKDAIAAYARKYCQNNKERVAAQQRKYGLKYRHNNKESIAAQNRALRQTPKGRAADKINNQNRRARQRSLPNTLTTEQVQHALNYFDGCCAVCGRQLNDMFGEFTAAADHWVPLSYKGDDNPGTAATNIVPLCHGVGGCNNSKGAKMPDAWLKQQFGTRKANKIMKRIEVYFDSLDS